MTNNPLDQIGNNRQSTKLSFKDFSMRGKSEALLEKMGNDTFVLGRMAIKGQSTLFYAESNAGKTLLTIHLIVEAIQADNIDPSNVFYLNVDDHGRGFAEKSLIAERHGFHMIGGGFEGSANVAFSPDMLRDLLNERVESGKASQTIVILDTVKKFVDHMDKRSGRDFGNYTRPYISHGGTLIMLSHVNKHKDGNGKSVYAGTTDLKDDADCTYTLEVAEGSNSTRMVTFEHQKSRGDVSLTESYKYTRTEGQSYQDLLDSITRINGREATRERDRAARLQFVRDSLHIIDEVIACIRGGITLKTTLTKEVAERTAETRRKVSLVLTHCTGNNDTQFWLYRTAGHNAQNYYLNQRAKEYGSTITPHSEKHKSG